VTPGALSLTEEAPTAAEFPPARAVGTRSATEDSVPEKSPQGLREKR